MEDRPQWNATGKSRTPRLVVVLLGCLALVVFCALAYWAIHRFARSNREGYSPFSSPGPTIKIDPEGVLSTTSESFRMIAKKIGAAVVNVKATRGPKGGGRPEPGEDSDEPSADPFSDLFEQFGMRNPFRHRDQLPQTALGSGILIDRQGHIVTNNHVIENSGEIVVSIGESKTEIKAVVVGADARSDLAVLRLMSLPSSLPDPAEWADSDKVEVGDWAVAIGSPFSLGQSVTVGIVSAKGRRNTPALNGSNFSGELLQTDAAINPGNSGGPLCDLEGQVIGVNTAIYTRNGGYMGIGFAIPSNTAKDIVGRLMRDGKIVRGWIGVMIQALEPDLAKELGIKPGVGVGIHQVVIGGPAAVAGLKAGDIVTAINDRPAVDASEMQQEIGEMKPGQTVRLRVISYLSKKARTVTIKVGEAPANEASVVPPDKSEKPDRLGLVVEAAPKGQGVLVRSVRPGSIGDEVGIQDGDLIVRVNRKPMTTVQGFRDVVASAKSLSLEIRRRNQSLFLQFPITEPGAGP